MNVPAGKIRGVTGVILAGGASSRMGSNKALLPHQGGRIIEGIYKTLAELFEEVIVATNASQQYDFLPCRKVPDLHPGRGVLAGIHAGLSHSRESAIFAVACDMPLLNRELIGHLAGLSTGVDVVVPRSAGGFEPLHALYGPRCLQPLDELLRKGEQRVISLFPRVRVKEVAAEEVARFDPEFVSFVNINTPDDYSRLRNGEKPPFAVPAGARAPRTRS